MVFGCTSVGDSPHGLSQQVYKYFLANEHELTQPQMNPEKRAMLPKLAFTGFASRYREPKLDEGFQDITKVDFMVGPAMPNIRTPECCPC